MRSRASSKTYSRRGGADYYTLRVPVPASARAEGVRVFEHYHPKENPILNPTPARLRRDGVVTLVLSLFVVVATGALLALLLGAPIPKFLLSDSMRVEERSEELNYAAIALFGLLVSLGLIGSVAALWRIIFRKRNKLLVKIMIVIVIGIVAAYYIGQLLVLMGWL